MPDSDTPRARSGRRSASRIPGGRPVRAALGVVVVLAACMAGAWWWTASHPILPTLEGCQVVRDRDDRVDCVRHEAVAIYEQDGMEAMLEAMAEHSQGPRRQNDCHDGLHRAGWDLVRAERKPKQLFDEATELGSIDVCSDAFRHGVGQEALRGNLVSTAELAAFCTTGTIGAILTNCYHALGHAIGAERPAPKPLAADALCVEHAAGDVVWVDNCTSGYFMETMIADDPKADDPVAKCDGQPAHLQYNCGTNVSEVLLYLGEINDFDGRVEECERFSRTRLIHGGCLHKSAVQTARDDDFRKCAAIGDDALANVCAYGALFFRGLGNAEKAHERCGLEPDVAWGCFAAHGRWLDDYAQEPSKCAELDGDEATACLAGYHDCWPNPSGRTPEAACAGIRVEDRLRIDAEHADAPDRT